MIGRVPSSLSTRVSRRGFRVIDRAGWSVLGRACGLAGTLLPLSPGEGRIRVLRVMVISTAPVTCSVRLASVCGGGALLVVQSPGGLVVWWSEMRLGFAVFGGLRAWVVRNASGFDGFGRIRVDSVGLRRFLDHMPAKPPFPPETQTLFGPLPPAATRIRSGARRSRGVECAAGGAPHWGRLRCIGAGY